MAIWSGCASWNPNSTLSSTQFNHGGPSYSQPLTFSQTYSYDALDRLASVTDKTGSSTGTQNYARTFSYDALGNMWVGSSSGINPPGNTPTAGLYTNNQLTGGAYDAAGNQTIVNGNTITYDVENRQASVVGTGVNETYVYDADGKRVEKTGYNGSPATVFVYDASGQLASEYSTTPNSSSSTWYLTLDYLRTPRMVTDQSGAVISRHDYLPFGEEISANQAGRGAEWGPGSDTINQKFTGKERDSESALDYFGARYYASAVGRFSSPDEPFADQEPGDPQSWNLYGYVRNNPVGFTDQDGEECVDGKSENGDPCFTASATAKADLNLAEQLLLRSLANQLLAAAQAKEHAQRLAQSAGNWISQPRNPVCTAGYTGIGATIGFFAGGGLGTLGFAGGPAGLATVPGGAAGGAALGGAIGGLGGLVLCSTGSGPSGSGDGGDQPASEKTAVDMAKQIQRDLGKDARRAFHEVKEAALATEPWQS